MPQVNESRAGRDGAAVPWRARRLAWTLLGVTVALLAASPVHPGNRPTLPPDWASLYGEAHLAWADPSQRRTSFTGWFYGTST